MDLYRSQSRLARWSEVVLVVSLLMVLATAIGALAERPDGVAHADGKHPEVVISYGDDPSVTQES